MSRSKKRFTALLATILAVALMLGVIPAIPWVSANARASTVWFVPDEPHQIIHSDEATGWWGSAWGYKTAYLGNGLHFETKFPGTAVRTGFTQTFALDRLTFDFANMSNEQSKAVITMLLSASTYFTFDPSFSGENNTLDVALDTVNGRIMLEDGTVLLENEALKYANLADKAFTVAFRKDDDGYRVTVDVDNNTLVGTAAFTSAMIEACSDIRDEEHIVVGVAGGAGSEGLTGFDLSRIGGAKKASVKGTGTLTAADLAIPAANNFWPERLALQDAPTGGARMLFYNTAITNVRNGTYASAKMDGLYLKVNNISAIRANNPNNLPEIAFVFTNNDAYTNWTAADQMVALVLDTRNGKLRYSSDAKFLNETHVILSDEALKYKNIAQREVVLRLFKSDSGSYKVQMEIEGKEPLIGTLPAACVEGSPFLTDPNQAKLVITPAIPEGAGMPGMAEFMIDVVEYFSSAEGESGEAEDSDPDITRIEGVTYLDTSKLKIYGSTNSEIIGTKQAWAQSGGLIVTNLKTGVRMAFSNAVAVGHREGYADKLALDRTELTFRRLKGGDFGLVFGNQDNIYPIAFGPNTLMLAYSASGQKIYAQANDGTTADVITGIAPQVLEDNLFTYYFEDNKQGGYTLKVTAGENAYTGTIPANVISACGVSDFGAVEMSVNPVTTGDSFTIDFIGLRRLEDSDPDITRIEGVTYLDTSKLKIYGSTNSEIIGTKQAWAQSGGLIVTNLKTGVRMAFSNAVAVGHREGYADKLALDRTELTFRRLKGGDFGLVFGNQDNIYPIAFGPNTLMLAYSASGQKIYAQANDGTTADVITGIAPQVLEDNLFTYYFEDNKQGGYTLKVTAGENAYTGTIPANVISACGVSDFGAVEMSVNPVTTGDSFTIDFIGLRRLEDSDPDITRIEGVTYLDTSKLKIYGSTNSEIIGTKQAWAQSGGLIVTNLKTGVRMAFSNAVAVGHREGYADKLALDRTELTFRRLKGGDFGLVFGNQDNIYPIAFGPNTLMLAYSASGQKIYAQANDGTTADVITGIAPQVLEDNLFTYYFEDNKQGGYTLKVTAGENAYTGTIPANVISACGVSDFGAVEMSVNPVTTGDSFTIDFIGLRRLEETDPDIELIDGVIYLNKSLLKIHSNPNQHEQSTLKAWTDAGFMAATDLKKGVRFNFNTTEANVREGYKETMNLKGMQLHFRGFRGTGFGITIADTGSSYPPQFGAGTRSLAIRYDAAQKRIFAVTLDDAGVATETDLIQNITLSERAYFTYTFAINAQYGYDFTVSVDDATYTGVISKEVMDQAKAITNVGKIEVSVNSGGFSRTQIDYIGVRQLTLVDVTAVADVIRMIDSIGTVSLENGTPIRAARKAYEQLNKEEKEAVTNYGVLRKAEEDYRDLAVKADRALTYITVADSRHTGSTAEAIQKTVRVDWVNNMRASNVETGGLHLEFIGAVSGHREGYSKKVDMTDLLLQFDDLEAVYAENSRFAVLLGKDSGFYGIQYDPANPPLALVLDPAAGTLTAYPSGHVLIQSEYLKLEKLRGKRFSYELSANGENAGFTLTVRTAGQELQGTLSAEDIAAAKLLTNPAGCSIMLCPWTTETTATCTFSLDLIGVCQTAMLKKVERVKALIAALPSVITRDDIDMVNEVLASYRALSRTLRSLVDNQNILEKALTQVYELLKEDTSWGGEASSDASGEQGNAASPKTGETLPYIWLLLPILGLAAAAGSWLLKRKSAEAGDSLREGGTKSC